jgi:hypothetical protein
MVDMNQDLIDIFQRGEGSRGFRLGDAFSQEFVYFSG